MVRLLQGSSVDKQKYPHTYHWENLVRKHYGTYQDLIDAQTYKIQRTQRSILSLSYPRYYNSDLLSLNLLKTKQLIGEVDQTEMEMYKNIDPCIQTHFARTFTSGFRLPIVGSVIGGALFAHATYFNCSIPFRIGLFLTPFIIDFVRTTRDPIDDKHCFEFLNWIVGYRKAKCQAQRHRHLFQDQQTKKMLGKNNLSEMGNQLIALASQ